MKAKLLLHTALAIGALGGCVQEDQYTQNYARKVRQITRAACVDTLTFRRSFDGYSIPSSTVLSWPSEYPGPQGYTDLYSAREECLIGPGATQEPMGRAVISSKRSRERVCDSVVKMGVVQYELFTASAIRGRFQHILVDADTYIASCRERGFLPQE